MKEMPRFFIIWRDIGVLCSLISLAIECPNVVPYMLIVRLHGPGHRFLRDITRESYDANASVAENLLPLHQCH